MTRESQDTKETNDSQPNDPTKDPPQTEKSKASSTSTSDPNVVVVNADSNDNNNNNNNKSNSNSKIRPRTKTTTLEEYTFQKRLQDDPDNSDDDIYEDSMYDPFAPDPSCQVNQNGEPIGEDCFAPPISTIEEEERVVIDASCTYGGDDPDSAARRASSSSSSAQDGKSSSNNNNNNNNNNGGVCEETERTVRVDKHWGSDEDILKMRNKLRDDHLDEEQPRPPIFLMPGLASTRLMAWRHTPCKQSPLLSDVKLQDYFWLNLNLLVQMASIDSACWVDCLTLGVNQTDKTDGCKLRADEGLDAISSLAPGGIGSQLLVGGTNTVYAWLIQWLADNLGYDTKNILGLPYDWRLSPDRLESRDGFFTMTRRRIEAAVHSNGAPGIMVAHSVRIYIILYYTVLRVCLTLAHSFCLFGVQMGNVVFRYFLVWLRRELQKEAYARYIKSAKRRAKAAQAHAQQASKVVEEGATRAAGAAGGWMSGVVSGFDDWWASYFYGEEVMGANNDNDNNQEHQPQLPKKQQPPPEQQQTSSSSEEEADLSQLHDAYKKQQLWELAKIEGDDNFKDWLENHIWTYAGLSAPLIGAIGNLRAVLSGENMGLPMTDEVARGIELCECFMNGLFFALLVSSLSLTHTHVDVSSSSSSCC